MESSPLPLIGKIALITGASRGIGSAAAIALARAGCDVAVNYVRSHQEALDVVRSVEQLGRRALAVQADVSAEADVNRMMSTVRTELGEIDVLVNNAGINPIKPLLELDLADWNHTLATNLTSAFLVSQAVLPFMRKQQWGRLIFVSSIAAQTGGVIGPHYAASKAGMHGLMHSYANLLAKEGITSNGVAPALIDTEMIRHNKNLRPYLIPIGRFGHAQEVAEAITLLATNSYINGQTINLNGGWYMS